MSSRAVSRHIDTLNTKKKNIHKLGTTTTTVKKVKKSEKHYTRNNDGMQTYIKLFLSLFAWKTIGKLIKVK